MSNFGFLRLRVVHPYEAAFREARSAVGASALLASAEEFKTVAEAVADCSLVVGTTAVGTRQLQHRINPLEIGARLIHKRLPSSQVALLFGSERVGLSNDDLSYCHWLMRIPTRQEHRSVNLGQAVAICLYELARNSKLVSPPKKEKLVKAAELDRLAAILLEALRISGYLKSHGSVLAGEKLRRLIRRLRLSATDAEILLGMLRQIVWKLRAGKDSPH
jgi:tRNA/rRNA methyltransferase